MSKVSRTPLTTCPRCDHLCVGPSLLPCSHLLCRQCLLLLLDTDTGMDIDCPTCHSMVAPAHTPGSRQVNQFPTDVVMEQLVMGVLAEKAGGRCCVPHDSPSPPPSNLCLECDDVFCGSCSHVHRNTSISKHHTLIPLESSEPLESLPSSEPLGSVEPCEPLQSSEPLGSMEPPPSQRRAPSRGEDGDEDSRGDSQDSLLQHAVNTEVELYQQTMSTCDQVIDGLEDLQTRRQEDRHVLKAYKHHLLADGVIRDDVILGRFRHVRQECMSVAEADMKNVHQMQSRKIPGQKVDTQDIPQHRGTWWQGHFPELTWTSPKTAVYVALPVLVSLLLGLLMVTLLKSPVVPYSADTVVMEQFKSPVVPYSADTVVMEQVSPQSFSLTGSLCGDHTCSSHYDFVTDVLVTEDRRVVLTMYYQQSIVVQSSSGVQTVELGCLPVGLTQLPSGRVAVTCPLSSAVLLVSLGSSDHQIQRIQTGKMYWKVAAHPVDNTLIVGTWGDKPCIDVITLQGEVIRTLMDTRQLEVVTSLTVANGYLLVTDADSGKIHRIDLSVPGQPPVQTIAENLASPPWDTAVDTAGNVFIVPRNGDVVMRTSEGSYRPLLTGRRDGEEYLWCHVGLHHNRLLLVTVTTLQSGSYKSDVTEYQLLDR